MSNTFKTNRARAARKALAAMLNSNLGEQDKRAVIYREIDQSGTRYGDHRKMYAKAKVYKRKVERHKLNKVTF